jgi:hypothetical protein
MQAICFKVDPIQCSQRGRKRDENEEKKTISFIKNVKTMKTAANEMFEKSKTEGSTRKK